jgi:hypothetical protein
VLGGSLRQNHFGERTTRQDTAPRLLAAQQKDDNDDNDEEADRTAANDKDTGENRGE